MNRNILATSLALAITAACGTAYAQTAPTGCTSQDAMLSSPPVGTVGTGAYAGGGGSYAAGDNAAAEGLRDFAIGTNAFAGGSVGDASTACDLAIGDTAIAEGLRDTAIGVDSYVNGSSSVAAGDSATANGIQAVAVGTSARSTDLSVAVGAFASASATATTAIGPGAVAVDTQAVALGASSYAERGSAVSVGSDAGGPAGAFQRQLINLASGTEPFDAVNLQQLDAGGSAIAAWIGAGATFEAAGAGAFTSPMFVLSNPYTPGSYTTVADALTALDTAVTDVSKQPGPVGPQGPQGPAGKNGNDGSGTGTDPLAVHYDDSTETGATLQGADGTRIHNLADGIAPTDAANVSQVESALSQANAYTDLRIGQLNLRVNYALAAAAANANAAAAVAAQDPTHRNRVAVADGLAAGANAWTLMYQHITNVGVSWNVSLTGEQGGGSSAERQVGVGVGYSW